jgi:hypothetical protein
MPTTWQPGGDSPRLRERLELARDGLVVARRLARQDALAARREILRARRELRMALRTLAPRPALAPLQAPLLALLLELGRLARPRA